ncbi:hypothetical protein BDZ94DRAFT_1260768 [Collybia nuda]|uniref:DUF302 domain-containing protein n=1 Tax=Collybia nuda TaxID=64659 RepID=A0A9P5Y347_9AGAR|nr:hypothetical protein BDZ94DRAFT_1260768 [Collybia nuda]
MKKSVTPLAAKLVTFETTLSFKNVMTRLDLALNKTGSAHFIPQFKAAKTKEEIDALIKGITGDRAFLYFLEMNHNKWMDIYDPSSTHPAAAVYTIGNPLIAQEILLHDIRAGYNIPPRIMILEKAHETGTAVIYHLPSSVMVLTDDPRLKAAAESLDAKLEEMITEVVSD